MAVAVTMAVAVGSTTAICCYAPRPGKGWRCMSSAKTQPHDQASIAGPYESAPNNNSGALYLYDHTVQYMVMAIEHSAAADACSTWFDRQVGR